MHTYCISQLVLHKCCLTNHPKLNGLNNVGFFLNSFIEIYSPAIQFTCLKCIIQGLPWCSSGKESAFQFRGHGFKPWPGN